MESVSSFCLHTGFRDETQITRLVRQAPLPPGPNSWPCTCLFLTCSVIVPSPSHNLLPTPFLAHLPLLSKCKIFKNSFAFLKCFLQPCRRWPRDRGVLHVKFPEVAHACAPSLDKTVSYLRMKTAAGFLFSSLFLL